MTGILLCDELMFQSRITGTASQLGLAMKTVRTQTDVLTLADAESPSCVIVDLANATLAVDDLMQALSKGENRPFVVGYGSHVDVQSLQNARDAGCDLVLPRSKFVESLPTELPKWYGGALK